MHKKLQFLTFTIFLFASCSSSQNPDTKEKWFPFIQDENRYVEVMNSFENHPAIQHFPKTIPSNATQVEFVYEPKRMQGAMFVELLVTLPEDEVEKIESEYKELAKYQFDATGIPEDGPVPIPYLLSDENNKPSENFNFFVLDAQPGGKEDHPWNHGIYYGIGINKRTLQVIYWCKYW
jgi:hypothetical protein